MILLMKFWRNILTTETLLLTPPLSVKITIIIMQFLEMKYFYLYALKFVSGRDMVTRFLLFTKKKILTENFKKIDSIYTAMQFIIKNETDYKLFSDILIERKI